jgi:hypothetical protein
MEPTWSFSDYGEWLDEGTSEVLQGMGARAVAPESRSFVSVSAADFDSSVVHDQAEHAHRKMFGLGEIGYITYRLVGERIALWDRAILSRYRDHGVAA